MCLGLGSCMLCAQQLKAETRHPGAGVSPLGRPRVLGAGSWPWERRAEPADRAGAGPHPCREPVPSPSWGLRAWLGVRCGSPSCGLRVEQPCDAGKTRPPSFHTRCVPVPWALCRGWSGDAMNPSFMVLLCLGLCAGPRTRVQAGTLPKPSIWADPSPLVAVGSPVTLWCQGSLQAEVYHMYTESGRHPWETRPQQDSRHKASFSVITSMSSHDTGQYCCVYWTSLSPSQPSDPLTLVVMGKVFPLPTEEETWTSRSSSPQTLVCFPCRDVPGALPFGPGKPRGGVRRERVPLLWLR
uniref:Ig-like domain-containing protein n=1 Tax=Oryctolagus cuniculus TaxID=9986 RepID=A0A5F9CZS0_RABIT